MDYSVDFLVVRIFLLFYKYWMCDFRVVYVDLMKELEDIDIQIDKDSFLIERIVEEYEELQYIIYSGIKIV